MNEEVDMVNHPPHYTQHPSGVECIEVTEHMPFTLGNAVKYLHRCGDKGNNMEDLRKAMWYINRAVSKTPCYSRAKQYIDHEKTDVIIALLWQYTNSNDKAFLKIAQRLLNDRILHMGAEGND